MQDLPQGIRGHATHGHQLVSGPLGCFTGFLHLCPTCSLPAGHHTFKIKFLGFSISAREGKQSDAHENPNGIAGWPCPPDCSSGYRACVRALSEARRASAALTLTESITHCPPTPTPPDRTRNAFNKMGEIRRFEGK